MPQITSIYADNQSALKIYFNSVIACICLDKDREISGLVDSDPQQTGLAS